jgi:hypothetical protein
MDIISVFKPHFMCEQTKLGGKSEFVWNNTNEGFNHKKRKRKMRFLF